MSKKILVVDDSKSMRSMIAMTLKQDGYDVSEAEDGVQALEIVKSETFDAVMSDVNMPNMGGIEFVKNLKQISSYKFIPVIFLTTESGQDMKEKGKSVGATGWMVKPFKPESIIKTMQKVLH